MQLHGPDVLGQSPTFGFELTPSFGVDMVAGDVSGKLPKTSFFHKPLSDSSLNLGHWTDFVIKIKYAKDETGAVEIWRRNEGVANFTSVFKVDNIPTLQYNSDYQNGVILGNYWKTGYYRNADGSIINTLYNDSITRGDSFEAVVAAAWPNIATVTGAPTPTVTPKPTTTPIPGLVNLSLGKAATQSSDYFAYSKNNVASFAIDGNTDGNFLNGSVSHTLADSNPPAWWQVDLGGINYIQYINVWNRTDSLPERLTNFNVYVSDNPFTSTDITATKNQAGVTTYNYPGTAGSPTAINVNRTGRYVRIQLNNSDFLSLAEVQVMGSTTIKGDANNDGETNLIDFSIWKTEYLNNQKNKADFNGDGTVDLVDFLFGKRHTYFD